MQSTEAGKRLKLKKNKKTDILIQNSSIGATGSWKFLQRRRLAWIWLAHVSGLSAPYLQEISLVTHITIHVKTQKPFIHELLCHHHPGSLLLQALLMLDAQIPTTERTRDAIVHTPDVHCPDL